MSIFYSFIMGGPGKNNLSGPACHLQKPVARISALALSHLFAEQGSMFSPVAKAQPRGV